MRIAILGALTFASSLAGQVLVADRGLPAGKPAWQRVEVAGQRFPGDSFREGAAGETWVRDAVRLWAAPSLAAAPTSAGDRLRKFREKGVPDGFADAATEPLRISVPVWAHRAD